MYQTINDENYNRMMSKIRKSYIPQEDTEKKKKKLTLKQIFFLKKKYVK